MINNLHAISNKENLVGGSSTINRPFVDFVLSLVKSQHIYYPIWECDIVEKPAHISIAVSVNTNEFKSHALIQRFRHEEYSSSQYYDRNHTRIVHQSL